MGGEAPDITLDGLIAPTLEAFGTGGIPDSLRPRSPTIVSNFFGIRSTAVVSAASPAAWSTSSSEASRLPYLMLYLKCRDDAQVIRETT